MLAEITEKLVSSEFTIQNVSTMWDMCRFDRAWDNSKLSPWCSVSSQIFNILVIQIQSLLYRRSTGVH